MWASFRGSAGYRWRIGWRDLAASAAAFFLRHAPAAERNPPRAVPKGLRKLAPGRARLRAATRGPEKNSAAPTVPAPGRILPPESAEMRLAPGRMECSLWDGDPGCFARRLARPGANFHDTSGVQTSVCDEGGTRRRRLTALYLYRVAPEFRLAARRRIGQNNVRSTR